MALDPSLAAGPGAWAAPSAGLGAVWVAALSFAAVGEALEATGLPDDFLGTTVPHGSTGVALRRMGSLTSLVP